MVFFKVIPGLPTPGSFLFPKFSLLTGFPEKILLPWVNTSFLFSSFPSWDLISL